MISSLIGFGVAIAFLWLGFVIGKTIYQPVENSTVNNELEKEESELGDYHSSETSDYPISKSIESTSDMRKRLSRLENNYNAFVAIGRDNSKQGEKLRIRIRNLSKEIYDNENSIKDDSEES